MNLESMPSIMTQYNNLYNGALGKRKVLIKSWRLLGTSEDDRKKFSQRLCLALVEWKKAISHPHILSILGISGDEAGIAPLSLVVPLCQNGNVNEYLSRNLTANILEILSGVAAGIHHLHSLKPPIVHGKLRGSNILISGANRPLLTDLCLRNLPLPENLTMSNTREGLDEVRWMAPEVVSYQSMLASDIQEGEATSNLYQVTRASDVHSFGMTALEILTHQPPFAHRKSPFGVIVDLTSGVRPMRPGTERAPVFSWETSHVRRVSPQPSISDELWDLITKCWAHNPCERPGIGIVDSWIKVLSLSEGIAMQGSDEPRNI